MIASWLSRISLRNSSQLTFLGRRFGAFAFTARRFSLSTLTSILEATGHDRFTSVSALVSEHSVLSLYRPLLSDRRWKRIVHPTTIFRPRLYANDGTRGRLTVNICPECNRELRSRGIEAWLTHANLPRVRYCALHACPLVRHEAPRVRLTIVSKPDRRTSLSVSVETARHHIAFAKDLHFISTFGRTVRLQSLAEVFRNELMSREGRSSGRKLKSVIARFYPRQFLDEVAAGLCSRAQLQRLLYGTGDGANPITYALASRALGNSMEEIFIKCQQVVANEPIATPESLRCINRHGNGCFNKPNVRRIMSLDGSSYHRCTKCKCEFLNATIRSPYDTAHGRSPSSRSQAWDIVVKNWERYARNPQGILIGRPIKDLTRQEVYYIANAANLPPRRQLLTSGRAATVGPSVVDLAERIVTRDGFRIKLTPYEAALCGVFLRHRGRVITRRRLWKEALGCNIEGPKERSNVLISRLRRKIQSKEDDVKRLRTVRGRGYVLIK